MDLLLIIILVVALYWRTMDYYYLIDDIVRRWGYLLEIPETSPPPEFYSKKPQKTRHLFLTLTHAVIVSIIYFLWGWKPAILFAVNPLSVSCTAWITGGYYQITTFFTLVSYFFLVTIPGVWGAFIAAIFFTSALGSTVNCIAIPFIFLVHPPLTGLALFWPLGFFLFGRRFRIGFRKRNIGKSDAITWKKAIVVPKVLAYYIKATVFPRRLAFFQEFGFEYGHNPKVKQDLESVNKHFVESIIICAMFIVAGLFLSPFGTLFYLAGILPFTQWKVLGQFVAERYLYLPLVGWSLILTGVFDHPFMMPLFWVVVGLYTYRAHRYIPAFKNIETLYENGIKNFPNCISNYVNLAERKLHTGKLYDAYHLLNKGLSLDKNSFLCHGNMAAYWLAINQPERGAHHTRMAMKNAELRGMAYNVFNDQLKRITMGIQMNHQARLEMDKIIAEVRRELKEETELCGKP
jgi:hypothetical protein